MTINPNDYDLNELREMARERGDAPEQLGSSAAPDPDGWDAMDDSAVSDSLRSKLHRELLPLEARNDDLEKPYLRRLPDNYAGEFLVFEWLEFLSMHAGYRGTESALGYYESIDWITEDVESRLSDYLMGIDEIEPDSEELTVDDHLVSLTYIAKLVSTV